MNRLKEFRQSKGLSIADMVFVWMCLNPTITRWKKISRTLASSCYKDSSKNSNMRALTTFSLNNKTLMAFMAPQAFV